jgi:glycosyltransferase involved in cell wall biosynthesis
MTSASAVRRAAIEPEAGVAVDRVLYAARLDPSRKYGSLEEQVCEVAQAMKARGGLLLPLFLAPSSPEAAAKYARAGLRTEVLDLSRFDFRTLRSLIELIRRERIDVVNWNFYAPLGNPYLWWLSVLRPGLRHRFTDHISRPDPGLPPPGRGPRAWLKRTLMRRYERIYSISDYMMQAHRAAFPRSRTARIRFFVNPDRFVPDAAARREVRASLGVSEDAFVIVQVTNLIPQKGVDVAIRAMNRLPADAFLWIVGGGEQEESLRGLIAELGLGGRVTMLGLRHNVAPFIQAADCLACPSVWGEALGLVNLEGMSCEKPVVASSAGGIPEFVRDGQSGLIVPPGDAEALAGAFRRLYEDPALRAELGRRARELVVREYSLASQIDNHVAEYVTRKRS